MALIFLAIFTLMGYGLINLSAIDAIEVVRTDHSAQAFCLAEAGLERALFLLRMDFVNDDPQTPPTPSWVDGDINGINWGPSYNYSSFINQANLGNGSYSVELKNVSGQDKEIWVKSSGEVNGVTRTIQIYLTIENRNIWNNAIFAAQGQSGMLINGNVDIRGSVHLLGNSLDSDDVAMYISGTGGIGNNYAGIDSDLAAIIPACPQVDFNGELVDSLSAKLRVRQGLVSLSGAGTVGEDDNPGNQYKETVDAVYINDGYTGNKGERNVYSDIGPNTPYGPINGPNYVDFPSLSEGFMGYGTYFDYLRANAFVVTDPAQLAALADIRPDADDFDFFDANGQIKLEDGHLTINGIVYIGDERDPSKVADLNIKSSQSAFAITYSGKASILVSGNVNIDADLLTVGANSYPQQSIIGIMTPNDVRFGPGSQLDVAGIFYGENSIVSEKQTEVVGSFVSNYFDMGTNVPSIYQVWEIVDNLPPGIIGGFPYWVCEISNWQEVQPGS